MFKKFSDFKIIWLEEVITSLLYLVAYPLIVVYFYQHKVMSVQLVSLLLFCTSFTARVGRLVLAPILDRIALNKLFFILQFVCFLGFALLALMHNSFLLFIACLFIGFCYGNSILIIRTMVATLKSTNKGAHTINFAKLNIATNLPSLVGPFIFNQLYNLSTKLAFLSFSIIALLSSIWSFIYTKHLKITKQSQWLLTFKEIIMCGKTQFIMFNVVAVWFLYSFAMTMFPLFLIKIFDNAEYTWLFMTLNALVIVTSSVLMQKFLIKLSIVGYRAVGLAFGLFAFAIACMFLLKMNLALLGFLVIIIALAELIAVPACNSLLTSAVTEDKKVAIFAVYSICIGLGEAIGNSAGFTIFHLFI